LGGVWCDGMSPAERAPVVPHKPYVAVAVSGCIELLDAPHHSI
jgi:hypothetical protein